ncbi:TetR/AcrR family transcriptional regulator [Dietzia sp. NCCP-2495]|uniref:TetR/AcrR family transcriptional regulator n=1 Tax=Dietzia sp. NCCP-2495 TaxID=2934675 RepID=UPI0022317E2A|nr:TetR/AcrR family transcriptional regulator [Dietzia sp. NCCP-2495]
MGKRDEARVETTERILAAARHEIERVGGVGLSMRSVAREVGMVSSAIYRYFPTREDLLTAMIVESYGALARVLQTAAAAATISAAPTACAAVSAETPDVADAAGPTADDRRAPWPDARRWAGIADSLRQWGRDRPHEFQLIYGTPIPGYIAPPETIPAAAAVAAPFLGCLGGRQVEGFDQLHRSGGEGLHAIAAEAGTSPSAAAAGVAAISELVGFVAHELAGHFVGVADPADGLYAAVVGRQLRTLGLTEGEDSGGQASACPSPSLA